MTGTGPPPRARERLDALRRRLYRSDATEEDVRRYAAEKAALQASEPAAPEAAEPPAVPAVVRPRRSRFVLPAAVAAVLLAAVAGIAVTSRPPARSDATPAATAPAGRMRSGTLGVDTGLSVAPHGAVVREPDSRTTVGDGTAVVAQRFTGIGPAVVPLDLTIAPFDGGRVVVTLGTSHPRPLAWRAIRLATRRDWSSYPEVVASSPSSYGEGMPFSTVASYGGAPPAWISVDADRGSRWTLAVTFLGRLAPHPSCTDLRSCLPG